MTNIIDVPRNYIDEAEDPEWNYQPPEFQMTNVVRTILEPNLGPKLVPGTNFVKPSPKAPALNHIFYDEPVEVIETPAPVIRAASSPYP